MSELEPIDPHAAARALKRELHPRRQPPGPKPITAGELGLAIAALTVSVLVSLTAIPAGILFHIFAESNMLTIIAVLPFALAAAVCGWIGRRSAMGVAGFALSIVAVIEAAGVAGYFELKAAQERAVKLQESRQATKLQNEATTRAIIERQKIEAEAELARIKARAGSEERVAESERIAADRKIAADKRAAADADARAKADVERQRMLEEQKLAQLEAEARKAEAA